MFRSPIRVVSLVLSSATATLLVACNPLEPRRMHEKEMSQVSVAFDPSTIDAELAAKMKTLRVRVYKVAADQRAAQEGADHRHEITAQKPEYTVSGIKVGMKEFEVSILDQQDTALGVGTVRHLVKPGLNKTAPIVIKLTQVSQPIVTMGVELNIASAVEGGIDNMIENAKLIWKNENGTQTGELSLVKGTIAPAYSDLKPAIDEFCVGCHEGSSAAKKLELDKFPFKSGLIADQAALMNKVMNRIQNETKPMPPDGLMATEEITRWKSWQSGGFLTTAATGTPFRGSIDGLKVGDKLLCELVITGADGAELLKKSVDAHVVALSGAMKIDITLNPETPSVAIPVVVQPAN